MHVDRIVESHFPEDVLNIVHSMSEITGAFYGILLQDACNVGGAPLARALSASLMYKLGGIRAKKTLESYPALCRDARGVIEVMIATIFTASPEYNFEVMDYSASEVIFRIKGVDRYHRIARQLGITGVLEWSVITPFIKGACDAVAQGWTVTAGECVIDENSHCDYYYRVFQSDANAAVPSVQMGTTAPFFRLPAAPFTTTGRYLSVDLEPATDFTGLLQLCISCEGFNANRLYPTGADQYMLGERLRAVRIGDYTAGARYRAVVESLLIRGRKRKSIIRILDDQGELAYLLKFDYYNWNAADFTQRFAHLKSETTCAELPAALPVMHRKHFDDPYNYLSELHGITAAHCAGHFDGYPCVPALLLFQVLEQEAERWLNDVAREESAGISPVPDNLCCHANRIMQADVPYAVRTKVFRLAAGAFRFVNTLHDVADEGIIFTTIEFDLDVKLR